MSVAERADLNDGADVALNVPPARNLQSAKLFCPLRAWSS